MNQAQVFTSDGGVLPLNRQLWLSKRAQMFFTFVRIPSAFIFLGFGYLGSHGNGTCRGSLCGAVSQHTLGIFSVIASIALALSGFFYAQLFSFKITENNIVINSGIFFRDSMMIPFDKVQDMDCFRGPFHMLFGVACLRIWTASQGQFSANRSRPAGALILSQEEASWLQEFIQQSRVKKTA